MERHIIGPIKCLPILLRGSASVLYRFYSGLNTGSITFEDGVFRTIEQDQNQKNTCVNFEIAGYFQILLVRFFTISGGKNSFHRTLPILELFHNYLKIFSTIKRLSFNNKTK